MERLPIIQSQSQRLDFSLEEEIKTMDRLPKMHGQKIVKVPLGPEFWYSIVLHFRK